MNRYVLGIVAILIAGGVAVWLVGARQSPLGGARGCTTEAKLCPDGSAVGRTGPNCEFAECPGATATSTGVSGVVLLGPTCPVMRIPPDPGCADKPYATSIVVFRSGSTNALTTARSDATGAFRIALAPGDYRLEASGGAMLPRCAPLEVHVAASGYTSTNIFCDTGIR